MNKNLSKEQTEELLKILKTRFEKNKNRHEDIVWSKVVEKLEKNPEKIWSLYKMEETGWEPDVMDYDKNSWEYTFFDFSEESPKNRRSFCYDEEALNSRKENKPKDSALNKAKEIWIEILNEEEYKKLQTLGKFDKKTSSWIKTPDEIRKLGWAIFADFRYWKVFVYHNWAESYYAARGFRGSLKV